MFWGGKRGADLAGEGVAGWLVWVVVRRFGKEKGREKWNKVGRKKAGSSNGAGVVVRVAVKSNLSVF